jgi:ATP-dependent DNA ligase
LTGAARGAQARLSRSAVRGCDGIIFNQHYDGDGAIIFKQACALGVKVIVSKRLGSPYRSGRVNDCLKIKNPAAPAVKREAENWSSVNCVEKPESWLP